MQMVGSSYDGNYIELYIFDSTQAFTPTNKNTHSAT